MTSLPETLARLDHLEHLCVATMLEPSDRKEARQIISTARAALLSERARGRDEGLEIAEREANGQLGIVAGVIAARIRALKSPQDDGGEK